MLILMMLKINLKGTITMGLFSKTRNVYFVHKASETKFKLCKVLNEYDSVDDANDDLVKLLTDERTERQVLKIFSEEKEG